ncbi:unnamed protein product [Parascedosporium putredinis]|uniref:Enoyl reductase (ER) domain-containing protein n=1 Tax=Parascedosporium putredinis TaxID=1442378 RepID=A0A9P1HB09_9PEZI|nr:unnamed protein product [Parascedosporium putredinis]CAI8001717.1 unnamed protein product [Parascedosporium putredinis]
MSRTTTALALTEVGGPFEMRQIQLDTIRPDEALIEIHATGICHTDISFANGTLPGKAGAILGHEGGGVVLQVGPDVTNVAPGDKVLLSFSHCETCGPCKSGHPAYCHDFNQRNFPGARADGTAALKSLDGSEPLFSSFFGQSSFARHTLVHKSCLVKTGAGAVMNTLDVKEGSTLAVFGAGSVGMSAIMAARLELAKRLGATHGVLGSGNVVEEIRKLCPPVGVDFAVDCTGSTKVIENMIESLGTRGKAATVGAPGFGAKVSVDVMSHLTSGRSYMGCCEGDSLPSQFVPHLIELHAQGKLPLDEMITVYDMKDYQKALDDTHAGKALKAVLVWRQS